MIKLGIIGACVGAGVGAVIGLGLPLPKCAPSAYEKAGAEILEIMEVGHDYYIKRIEGEVHVYHSPVCWCRGEG